MNIHVVERFLGDEAIRHGWQFEASSPSTGKQARAIRAGSRSLLTPCHLRIGDRVTPALRWHVLIYGEGSTAHETGRTTGDSDTIAADALIECDNCYRVCPGDSVFKLGSGKHFQFNYDNGDARGLCSCRAIVKEASN